MAPPVRRPYKAARLPREMALASNEEYAPFELKPELLKELVRVEYDAASPFAGRVFRLPGWTHWSMERRIAFMRLFGEHTARDPAIALKATRILRDAGVSVRDYRAAWTALLLWVQQNIRFTGEQRERLQSPQATLTLKMGDCLPADTLLLTAGHRLMPISEVVPGMRVWGRDRWSVVEAVAAKGDLAVDAITLNNGSTFRATPGHKVYVEACEKHGPTCPDLTRSVSNCKHRKFTTIRIPVSDLTVGMVLVTPERLPFGTETMDPRRAYVEGLYLADGWRDDTPTRLDGGCTSRFFISGKDGCPKEEQKREVAAICAVFGIETRWHARYLAVNDDAWAKRMKAMGEHAPEKRALSINLDEASAIELLRGLMADSGANTNGPGRTYSTTSPALALQARLLHKMQGRTCSWRYLEDHGGLGKHPIYRLGVRAPTGTRQDSEKRLRVREISRAVATVPCYDIQTDDHYVYLPEADVTVSNCDDMALILFALGASIRLDSRFVLSGAGPKGRARWIEGVGPCPDVNWTHVFLLVGWPPFAPTQWEFAEPTLDVRLGWDAMKEPIPRGRADMGDAAGAGETLPARATRAVKALPWTTIAGTVIGSVLSFMLTRQIASVLEKRKPRRR